MKRNPANDQMLYLPGPCSHNLYGCETWPLMSSWHSKSGRLWSVVSLVQSTYELSTFSNLGSLSGGSDGLGMPYVVHKLTWFTTQLPRLCKRRDGQLRTWPSIIKADLEVIIDPRIFGLRQWDLLRNWLQTDGLPWLAIKWINLKLAKPIPVE